MKPLTLGNVTLDLPLSADLDGLHGASYVDTSDKNRTLATLSTDGHRELAVLFAASPDLLLAAEALLDIHSLGTLAGKDKAVADATDALIAAIARARSQQP